MLHGLLEDMTSFTASKVHLLSLEPMNHELDRGSGIVCDWSDMTNEFDVVPDNNTDDHETEGSEKK